jgi:hypothetical protein
MARRGATTLRGVPSISGLAVFLALLALPTVGAHAAPASRDYETRLIHDCVDDYYGGDMAQNKDGHDVIALDLRENYVQEFGDSLVFRLIMNGGYSGSVRPILKDDIIFSTAAAEKHFAFTTTDNRQFQSTFDSMSGPTQVMDNGKSDGTRFALEGTLKLSTVGLKPGDTIRDFRVDSYVGANRADYMPGTYDTLGQPAPVSCTGNTLRPDHRLQGSGTYVDLRFERDAVQVRPGQDQMVQATIKNRLAEAQAVTVSVSHGNGYDAGVHSPTSNVLSHSSNVDVPAQGETIVQIRVKGYDPGARGTVPVDLYTDLGGHTSKFFAVNVGTALASSTTSQPPAPSGGSSPGPGLGVLLVGLAVALGATRGPTDPRRPSPQNFFRPRR